MSNIWMPLYVADYLSKTGHLTTVEHGAYMLLIMQYWTHESLPDDDRILAQIARMPLKEWRKIRGSIASYFVIEHNSRWCHERIDQELEKAANLREKKRKAGLASANSRSTGVQQVLEQNTQQNANQSQSQSHTPSLRSGVVRKARSRLPESFPLKENLDWAVDLWLQKGRTDLCNALSDEVEKFRDHHSGKLTASADWPASWRTWARNALRFNNGGYNGRNAPRRTAHDKFAEGAFLAAGGSIERMENGGICDTDSLGPPLLEARFRRSSS